MKHTKDVVRSEAHTTTDLDTVIQKVMMRKLHAEVRRTQKREEKQQIKRVEMVSAYTAL